MTVLLKQRFYKTVLGKCTESVLFQRHIQLESMWIRRMVSERVGLDAF